MFLLPPALQHNINFGSEQKNTLAREQCKDENATQQKALLLTELSKV